MDIIVILGQVLFGAYFIMGGMNHLKKKDMMVEYSKQKNLPFPSLLVFVSGIVWILVGIALVLGIYLEVALWSMVALLILINFKMHAFWSSVGDMKMDDMRHFMKNTALLGVAFMLLSFIPYWPWTLF